MAMFIRISASIVALVLTLAPAVATEVVNPDYLFKGFEKDCRVGKSGLDKGCELEVYSIYSGWAAEDAWVNKKGGPGTYAEITTDKVSCDFGAFWRVRDAKFHTRGFATKTWLYGVRDIVAEPGVCRPIPPPSVSAMGH